MMIRYLTVALLLAAPALAQETVQLKPGPGLDAVQESCATCHTLNYIKMNSVFMTPEVWKAEVAKMRGPYGAPITDETADVIVKYLSTTYGTPPKS